MALPSQALCEVSNLGICPTINTLVTLEALLNPSSDVQPFTDQLCVSERLLVSRLSVCLSIHPWFSLLSIFFIDLYFWTSIVPSFYLLFIHLLIMLMHLFYFSYKPWIFNLSYAPYTVYLDTKSKIYLFELLVYCSIIFPSFSIPYLSLWYIHFTIFLSFLDPSVYCILSTAISHLSIPIHLSIGSTHIVPSWCICYPCICQCFYLFHWHICDILFG